MKYEIHPAAKRFPLMTAEEFQGLRQDIENHGLREAIIVCKGKVRNMASSLNFHSPMILGFDAPRIAASATGHAQAGILRDHYIRADIIAARHIAETLDRIHEEEKIA